MQGSKSGIRGCGNCRIVADWQLDVHPLCCVQQCRARGNYLELYTLIIRLQPHKAAFLWSPPGWWTQSTLTTRMQISTSSRLDSGIFCIALNILQVITNLLNAHLHTVEVKVAGIIFRMTFKGWKCSCSPLTRCWQCWGAVTLVPVTIKDSSDIYSHQETRGQWPARARPPLICSRLCTTQSYSALSSHPLYTIPPLVCFTSWIYSYHIKY